MVDWYSISTQGGEIQGFNTLDKEIFHNDKMQMNSLVRESIQNSMDARTNLATPAIVEFSKFSIRSQEIPGHERLVDVMTRCYENVKGNDDQRSILFFEKAKTLLNHDTMIDVLRISDKNTTGLDGAQPAQASNILSKWTRFIKSNGVANNNANAGGSHGIGKKALYAKSDLGTIFVASRDTTGYDSYIGVSKLISFQEDGTHGGSMTTGELYYTDDPVNKTAIHGTLGLDPIHKRTESGTDIFLLGIQRNDKLYEDIRLAVLRNFAMSVLDGKLEVKVGNDWINAKNISGWMKNLPDNTEDFHTIHAIYNTYTHGQQEKSPASDFYPKDACTLYIQTNDTGRTSVFPARETGMWIPEGISRGLTKHIGCNAVLRIQDTTMNSDFRLLENADHTRWECNNDLDSDEVRNTKKAKMDWLVNWINEVIKALDIATDDSFVIYGMDGLVDKQEKDTKETSATARSTNPRTKTGTLKALPSAVSKPNDSALDQQELINEGEEAAVLTEPPQPPPVPSPKPKTWTVVPWGQPPRFMAPHVADGKWIVSFKGPSARGTRKARLKFQCTDENAAHVEKEIILTAVEVLDAFKGKITASIGVDPTEKDTVYLEAKTLTHLPKKDAVNVKLEITCNIKHYCVMEVTYETEK